MLSFIRITFLLLFLLFAATFSFRSMAAPMDWETYQVANPLRIPKYFFRAVAHTPYVSYTTGWRNYLMDIKTGTHYIVPYLVDAIPSPDGAFVTVPNTFYFNFGVSQRKRYIPEAGELFFYKVDTLNKHVRGKRPFYVDKEMPGGYQTIAVTGSSSSADGKFSTTHYRIVTESFFKKMSLFLQDYTFVKRNSDGAVISMKKATVKPRPLCSNVRITLPMISKSGKLFAAVDPHTRHMKIYDLLEDGSCRLKRDLAMPTSKVDFSYDDKKIAFHVSPVAPKAIAHVVRTQKRYHKLNIMVYDLEKDSFEWITQCENANCYYPSFLPDGRIGYLKQYKERSRYEFVFIQPKH